MSLLDAICSIPVDRWAYQADGTLHLGQDGWALNVAVGKGEENRVWVGDLLKCLVGAVQELRAENADLRAMIEPKRRKAA